MAGSRHEAAALAAAAVLHGLVLGVAPRLLPPALVDEGAHAVDAIELEIEVAAPTPPPSPWPAAPAEPTPAPAVPEPAAVEPRAAKLVGEPRAKVVDAPKIAEPLPPPDAPEETAPPAPASPPAPLPAPGPAPAAPDGYSPPSAPPGPVTGLPPGLGGSPVWSVPGVLGPVEGTGPAPAPTSAPAPAPVERDVAGQVLRGTIAKKDSELGLTLPAAGVVAGTLADAVRSSAAPADARATFEVQIGGNGKVNGVRLVSSSAGSEATWQNVTQRATAALGVKALAMTGDAANGATVIVKVESKEAFAAGSKKQVDVKPVCANEIVEELADALKPLIAEPSRDTVDEPETPSAAAKREPPPAPKPADARRKLCIPIGVAGVGDASNLGTHLQKTVRTSYQVVVAGNRKLPADEAMPLDKRAPWLEAAPGTAEKVYKPWKRPPKKKKKKGETDQAR